MSNNKDDKLSKIFQSIGELSTEDKLNAIKKEEYFRDLYVQFYKLDQTKDFIELSKMLVEGYELMSSAYNNKPEIKDDINYIIKFAFRDFYLLLFINQMNFFNSNDFLKKLHKKVYFSNSYVTEEDFNELINYCRSYIKENEQK